MSFSTILASLVFIVVIVIAIITIDGVASVQNSFPLIVVVVAIMLTITITFANYKCLIPFFYCLL